MWRYVLHSLYRCKSNGQINNRAWASQVSATYREPLDVLWTSRRSVRSGLSMVLAALVITRRVSNRSDRPPESGHSVSTRSDCGCLLFRRVYICNLPSACETSSPVISLAKRRRKKLVRMSTAWISVSDRESTKAIRSVIIFLMSWPSIVSDGRRSGNHTSFFMAKLRSKNL
jgi:hypothetical protein